MRFLVLAAFAPRTALDSARFAVSVSTGLSLPAEQQLPSAGVDGQVRALAGSPKSRPG